MKFREMLLTTVQAVVTIDSNIREMGKVLMAVSTFLRLNQDRSIVAELNLESIKLTIERLETSLKVVTANQHIIASRIDTLTLLVAGNSAALKLPDPNPPTSLPS